MTEKESIKQKAIDLRNRLGGTIFIFPAEAENPYSEYAMAAYVGGGKWKICPGTGEIQDVCGGLAGAIQESAAMGVHIDYNRDVRIITYPAQMNAPSVIMRRLRDNPGHYTTGK
ncbi:MAG: hypothetical protein M0Z41_13690 [Peptococcaceae bacterium]|jgi:hypothetical protein|nr:hypothetical protein [Peptococcaceae bacterium]